MEPELEGSELLLLDFLIFFLFARNFESITYNKMMMFREKKEFALHLYVKGGGPGRNRSVKGSEARFGGFFFRAGATF